MEDKRKLERFELKMPAKIEAVDVGPRQVAVDLHTNDVCAGGAFFPTLDPLPEGTRVNVEMLLPLERLKVLKESSRQVFLLIKGTVLRCQDNGMAVEFTENYTFGHTPRLMPAMETTYGHQK